VFLLLPVITSLRGIELSQLPGYLADGARSTILYPAPTVIECLSRSAGIGPEQCGHVHSATASGQPQARYRSPAMRVGLALLPPLYQFTCM